MQLGILWLLPLEIPSFKKSNIILLGPKSSDSTPARTATSSSTAPTSATGHELPKPGLAIEKEIRLHSEFFIFFLLQSD